MTAAKVVSLNHRGWPIEALMEDFSGLPSEAIELFGAILAAAPLSGR